MKIPECATRDASARKKMKKEMITKLITKSILIKKLILLRLPSEQ